jgi:hypothetical protein
VPNCSRSKSALRRVNSIVVTQELDESTDKVKEYQGPPLYHLAHPPACIAATGQGQGETSEIGH